MATNPLLVSLDTVFEFADLLFIPRIECHLSHGMINHLVFLEFLPTDVLSANRASLLPQQALRDALIAKCVTTD